MYIQDSANNKFVVIQSQALASPTDLDFNRDSSKPFELWVINQSDEFSGGSTVIINNANVNTRTWEYVKDGNAWHFMSLPSAIAFGDGTWATTPDVQDCNHQGGKYTGPSLWTSDRAIYGKVGNPPTAEQNGSHLDMVHQSPFSKGIAWERDMVYWVMDGYEGRLKRYDFVSPHYPGGDDHSNAKVRVYTDYEFSKDATLPSHIVIDENKQYLYGCYSLAKRIFRADITTGSDAGNRAKVNSEPLAEYKTWTGMEVLDIIDQGLNTPVGIDVYGDRLLVTDNATDEIIIYDISNSFKEIGRIKLKYPNPDPMGIKVGPDGRIYFADKANNKVYMIDNPQVRPLSVIKKDLSASIILKPNPTEGNFIIEWKKVQPLKVELYNSNAERIFMGIYSGTSQANIDLTKQAAGLYYVKLTTADQSITRRVQKL